MPPGFCGRRCTARIRFFSLFPSTCFGRNAKAQNRCARFLSGKHANGRLDRIVTLIAWGNTVEKALEAIEQIENEASIELIDLRSISPWDRETIEESVRKTGRVVIVQEDTENCSVGQMIITHLASNTDLWTKLVSPPILVSKGNVMIGYNPIYEYAALPDVQRIVAAIRKSISIKNSSACSGSRVGCGRGQRGGTPAPTPTKRPDSRGRRPRLQIRQEHHGSDHGRRNSFRQNCGFIEEARRSPLHWTTPFAKSKPIKPFIRLSLPSLEQWANGRSKSATRLR